MIVIAGGILLALLVVMVIVGLGLLARDGARAVKRNARGIGAALLGVGFLGFVFGVCLLIGSLAPTPTQHVAQAAPYVARDFSKVPHTLTAGPRGVGYYEGSKFVCVSGC